MPRSLLTLIVREYSVPRRASVRVSEEGSSSQQILSQILDTGRQPKSSAHKMTPQAMGDHGFPFFSHYLGVCCFNSLDNFDLS